jgi:hypothetical protein
MMWKIGQRWPENAVDSMLYEHPTLVEAILSSHRA